MRNCIYETARISLSYDIAELFVNHRNAMKFMDK